MIDKDDIVFYLNIYIDIGRELRSVMSYFSLQTIKSQHFF